MSDFEIVAEARSDLGKGATRRLRRTGMVPAVLYGGDKAPATLAVRGNELKKQLENEAFYSHILTVKTPAGSEQAVLKALQRHPATDDVTHVDLLRTSATQTLTMHVPVHFVNEDGCPGRKAGGVVQHAMNDVEVSCLPKDLPEYIEVDMAGMDIGDSVHLTDLKLPEGVTLTALGHGDIEDHDQVVVSILAPRVEVDEDAEDGEEADREDED